MNVAVGLGALAGALAGAALATAFWAATQGARGRIWGWIERSLAFADGLIAPLRRAERSGTRASSRDRVRLVAAATAVGLVVGWGLAGPIVAIVSAAVCGSLVPRAVGSRARRYRQAVDQAAAAVARALAGALAAGRSVRASVGVASGELRGPAADELAAVAAALELGVPTDQALDSLRDRCRSRRIDLIVAAITLQRRAGGDLATLLRSIAGTIEESDRLRDEARAASAQARFTSTIVLAMPVAAALLGELAAPGTVSRIGGSPVALWMVGVALAMQVAGGLIVRRMARVEL